MIGAIAGDMIGPPDERYPMKNPDFIIWVAGFTDDTVLTVAVAGALLERTGPLTGLDRVLLVIQCFQGIPEFFQEPGPL
jgi:ADP-ribosylglycohydrolase